MPQEYPSDEIVDDTDATPSHSPEDNESEAGVEVVTDQDVVDARIPGGVAVKNEATVVLTEPERVLQEQKDKRQGRNFGHMHRSPEDKVADADREKAARLNMPW